MTTTRQIQQLFEQHYQMLFRQAFSMLHDAEESRDMVHDVFAYLQENANYSSNFGIGYDLSWTPLKEM